MEMVNLIYQRDELVKLAALIDWPAFEQAWGPSSSHHWLAGAAHSIDDVAALPEAHFRAVR